MSSTIGFELVKQPLLGPVIALNLWTFVIEIWFCAVRGPALEKYKFKVLPSSTRADFDAKLPAHVQWPTQNYNHLLEQPTQFYAVALALTFLGMNDTTTERLAWTYVGLRIVHSLIHATVNAIKPRFWVFASSSMVLLAMTIRAAGALWSA